MLNIPSQIIALCKADSTRKNFRVHFPNGENADLTNADIVAGTVQFTESVSSKDVLQFGLAEASRIQFECVNVQNIYGMTIECGIEIDTSSLTPADITSIQSNQGDGTLVLESASDIGYGFYRIPYGVFTVTSCPRSAGAMWRRRVEAYTTDNVYIMSNVLYTKLLTGTESTRTQNPFLIVAQEINNIDGLNMTEQTEAEDFSVTWNQYTFYPQIPAVPYTWWYDGADRYVVYLMTGEIHGIHPNVSNNTMYRFTADIDTTFFDTLSAQLKTYNVSDSSLNLLKRRCFPEVDYGVLGATSYMSTRGATFENPEDSGYVYIFENSDGTRRPYIVYYTALLLTVEKNGTEVYRIQLANTPVVSNPVFKSYTLSGQMESDVKIMIKGQEISSSSFSFIDSIDVKSLIIGNMELCGQFLQYSRNGNTKKISLSKASPISMDTDEYSSMWFDEYDISPIGTVQLTYRDIDLNTEPTIVYEYGGGLSVYDMTNNYLLKNLSMSVNDLTNQTVEEYVKSLIDTYFVPNVADIAFTPVQLDSLGLPYLEDGDYLEIDDGNNGTVGTYILNRTISGEQFLQDDIESKGGEIIGNVRSA